MLDGAEKLIAALGTAFAAILTPIAVIYGASLNGKNKKVELTLEALGEEVERLEEKLAKAEACIEEERISGLRWYQLVILWFNQAHDMRRLALDARKKAEDIAEDAELPKPVWEDSLHLLLMEEPIPRNKPNSI